MSYDATQPEARHLPKPVDIGDGRRAYAEFSDDGRTALFTVSLPDPDSSVAPTVKLDLESIQSASEDPLRAVLSSSDTGDVADLSSLFDYALETMRQRLLVGSVYVRTRDAGLIAYLDDVYFAVPMQLVGQYGRETFQILSLQAVEMVARRSRETGESRAIDAFGLER
jgi:hypothetical protein